MAGGNPFMPPGRGPSGPPQSSPAGPSSSPIQVPPSKQGQPFAEVHTGLKYAQNAYKQNVKAQQVLDHLRVQLDKLMEMGDTIRPEDVIESAGTLVGHGISPYALAQIMADMPATGGEGLASWVRLHDQTITMAEMQLVQETAVKQQRMGVAGIKSLAALHLQQEAQQGPKPPIHIDMTQPQGNSLMPQGPAPQAASQGPVSDSGGGANDAA